jgi:signal peptidase I
VQVASVLLVVACALAVRALVAVPVLVDGRSMQPTLHDRDLALVSRLTDVSHGLRHGDLVVFRDPDGELSVKRVAGLAGDVLDIRDSVLEVDGAPVDEPYVDHSPGTYFQQVQVPAGHLFLLGDNRLNSIDSRDYGPVDERRVVGRVLLHT